VPLDSPSKSKDVASSFGIARSDIRLSVMQPGDRGGVARLHTGNRQISDPVEMGFSRCRIGLADVDTQSDSERQNRVEWHLTVRSIAFNFL
jgi:hypothetical protein